MNYRDRGIPRAWRNRHWGPNGEPDWGEKAWPGWEKPIKFWDSKWPAVIILAIGAAGLITVFAPALLLLWMVLSKTP